MEEDTSQRVYFMRLFIGIPLPGREVTSKEAQQILDNLIYHGLYYQQHTPKVKLNLIMSMLFFCLFAYTGGVEFSEENYIGFIVACLIFCVMWTVVVKYIVILWLLDHYEYVLMAVPKIAGLTSHKPEKKDKRLYKILHRGPRDLPISIVGTFLPKSIIAGPKENSSNKKRGEYLP